MIRAFTDIMYTVHMELHASGTRCDFDVYEIQGIDHATQAPIYRREGVREQWPGTESVDIAELWASGSVTWDGAMEVEMRDRFNFGHPDDAADVGTLFVRVYEMAREIIGAKADWKVSG